MLQMLSFEFDVDWKDIFLFVLAKDDSDLLFQQLYPSFIDKIAQKSSMIFTKVSRHE